MSPEQIKVGACYKMPSGVHRRVVSIYEKAGIKWVRLEKMTGRNIGLVQRESLKWFAATAIRELIFIDGYFTDCYERGQRPERPNW